MDANDDSSWENGLDWTSTDDDELEGFDVPLQASFNQGNSGSPLRASPSTCNGASFKTVHHFEGMGFSREMVIKAIEKHGEDNMGDILETLLTYSEDTSHMSEKDEILSMLVDMGYNMQEALIAIDKCGHEAQIYELTDFISAAQIGKEIDSNIHDEETNSSNVMFLQPEEDNWEVNNEGRFGSYRQTHIQPNKRIQQDHYTTKRMKINKNKWKSRKYRASEEKSTAFDEEVIHIPNPMIGFGTPYELCPMVKRKLPEIVAGPPYFYYENVACTPKGVWSKISRFLYEIEPEFVDSKFFCAAARKRGYIHNLPIHNRYPLVPLQPLTIQEALPSTRKWWPSWDKRTSLNCLLTCLGSAKLTERIRKKLEECDDEEEPPKHVKKFVLEQCKKWNLVWVGKNKVAPLEPCEMEKLLGFPSDHTRGGGICMRDRYKGLGNAFQVDTVGYHLSVLKGRFPNGMNVLSLFSGIGGAEVALDRLGIFLKNVVSVEIYEVNRNIFRSWWEQTNQTGNLIEVEDVQQVSADKIEAWITSFGGFDLIIGGSPCNNLAGGNRVSRDGLEGKESSLFYEYFRILDLVKTIMGR